MACSYEYDNVLAGQLYMVCQMGDDQMSEICCRKTSSCPPSGAKFSTIAPYIASIALPPEPDILTQTFVGREVALGRGKLTLPLEPGDLKLRRGGSIM